MAPEETKKLSETEAEQKKLSNLSSNIARLPTRKQSLLVLINPHSGRGKSVSIYKKKLAPFLESHDIDHEVFITESESRVHDYIQSRSLTELLSYKTIVVVSGDGLLYETINALMSRPDWQQVITVPIGVIPTGSGNGLAYTLIRQNHHDLQVLDDVIKICCEQAIQNNVSEADLVKITFGPNKIIWSFLSIGWGLLADIDIDSEWLRRLGELRFTIYGLLRSVTSVTYNGRLSYKIASDVNPETSKNRESNSTSEMYDSESEESFKPNKRQSSNDWVHIEDKFTCLYAVYQSHVSSVTNFAPKSTLTDQLIYLTYIRGKLSICQIIQFLLSIKDGSHEKLPYVQVVPVETFKFQPLETSKVVIDGEAIQWNLSDGPLTAEVVPKVIKFAWKP